MLLESGQLQTVSMSIHQTEGVCDGMGLRPGQWLKLKAKLSLMRMKVSLRCMISHEGGRMKTLLSTMDNAAWGKLCPQIGNHGIHLLKWENFWTSLICCRSHSFREVTNKKESVIASLCAGNNQKLHWAPTPLEYGIQKPGQAMYYLIFILTLKTGFVETLLGV